MPFETATTSVFGFDASSPKRSESNMSKAVVKSAERHATKWMRASAMAHLGLAIRPGGVPHQMKMPKSEPKSGTTDSRPYWMQGDESLNTKAAWAQRMKLRAHPTVLAKLQMWWECMIASVQSVDPERITIDKASYVRVSRLLHKAIIEEWDEADATQCAEDDWKNDAGGRSSIDQGRFLDCVFELADIWTRTIEADEYASFLQRLLDDVATTGGDGQRYFWREERDTKYGGYIMVDDEDADAAAAAAAAAADATADSGGGNGAGKDSKAGAGKGGDDGHGSKGIKKSPRGKGKKAKFGGEVGSHGSHGGKHDNAHAGGSGGHGGASEHGSESTVGGRRGSHDGHHNGHHNGHHERDEKEKYSKEAHGREEHAKDGRDEWRYSGQGKEHYVTGLGVGSEAAHDEEWKIGEHWKVAGHGGLEERKPGMDWGDREEAPKGTQLPPIARAAGGAHDGAKGVLPSLPSLPETKISMAQRREVRAGRVISAYGDPGPKPRARVSVAAAGLALKQDIDFLRNTVAYERSPGAGLDGRDSAAQAVPPLQRMRNAVFKLRWLRKFMGLSATMEFLASHAGDLGSALGDAADRELALMGAPKTAPTNARGSLGRTAGAPPRKDAKGMVGPAQLQGVPRAKVYDSKAPVNAYDAQHQKQERVATVSFGFDAEPALRLPPLRGGPKRNV